MSLTTYKDLIDHTIDWLGVNPGREAHRDARRAVLEAMRELQTRHTWSYYTTVGRIALVAPYQTGTCTYSAATRTVTLTGGTFPTWADRGMWLYGTAAYEVQTRVSGTQLILASGNEPGVDLASGTYVLYRDRYPLPINCNSIGELILVDHGPLELEHPSCWLAARQFREQPGTPRFCTVIGEVDYYDTISLAVRPAPAQAGSVEFLYLRRPRDLVLEEYTTGTVSCTQGSATLTGVDTNWSSRLAGSVVRISRTSELPTAAWGSNFPAVERIVTSVDSATQITLDATAPETLSNAPYILSDPVDIEQQSMLTALLRGIEYYTAMARMKSDASKVTLGSEYLSALVRAFEGDSRSFRSAAAGQRRVVYRRLADMPLAPLE